MLAEYDCVMIDMYIMEYEIHIWYEIDHGVVVS